MKLRSALSLAIILLVLFGYLYYYEKPKRENLFEEIDTRELIFDFDENNVRSFTFSLEYDDIVFTRDEAANGFIIEKPVNAKTDKPVIEKFFSELKKIRYKKVIEDEDLNLVDYKLRVPYYKITLDFKDNTQKVFSFGKMNMTQDMIYAKRDGDDKLYLVDIEARRALDQNMFSFRDKTIFKDNLSDVGQIQIVRGNDETILEKDGDDWFITKPKQIKADIVVVKALIHNLKNMKAVKFPDETKDYTKKCDFTKPDIAMILSSTDGEVLQSFMLIKKGPIIKRRLTYDEAEKEDCLTTEIDDNVDTAFFKMASQSGVHLIKFEDLKLLDKSLLDFRNKPVFSRKLEEIYKLVIIRGEKMQILSRDKKGAWTNVDEKGTVLSYDTINLSTIFNFLNFVEADEFIDDTDLNDEIYNFKSPTLTLRFYDKTGTMVESLTSGNIEGDHLYLQKLNDTTVYLIKKSFLKKFEL